jgi:agmatinase
VAFDPSAAAPADSGIYGLPHGADEARVVLIPVPFEATTSYRRGTARGPEAILEASKQVDLHDVEVGRPYEGGICMLPSPAEIEMLNASAREDAEAVIEVGGDLGADATLRAALDRVNAAGAKVNAFVEHAAKDLLRQGKIVGTIGGDHSTVFGAIAAHAEAFPGMGILHLDAHADLRHAYEGFEWSHASIMNNVMERLPGVAKLVQVGIRDLCDDEARYIERHPGRIVTHCDPHLAEARFEGETWGDQCRRMISALPKDVYLSFDIDGLDPALCPHTGTPVPGGLSFGQASHLMAAVVHAGKRIVGFDLNEVAPGPEGDDWDANVGARLLYKMIGWTLKSRG